MENTKKLGLGSAVSVCVGLIVATSCLLSLGQGMGLAGNNFIIALFAVLILNGFLALSFSELHSMMPKAEGGLGQYTLVGLGPVASMISTLSAYVIVDILSGSVEIAMCGTVLHQIFLPQIPAPVISVILLAVLSYVNYKGVDFFARIQNIVVFLLLASFLLMGIISFFHLGTGEVITAVQQTKPQVTGIGGIVSLSALAFWLFIGIEFVIPVSKDLKNPKRDVLLAMIIGIVVLFGVQALLGVGMTQYVTLQELASDPMPHMLFAERCMGQAGVYWMGIVTLLAGVSTVNTVLGSIPNILSGMAENELFPASFQKKNKYGVPAAGIALLSGGIIVLIVSAFTQSSGLTNIILAASCFWLTSYIMVNITVLVLRKRYPDAEGRNKKLMLLGIPQIICIIGDIYMILNIAEGDAKVLIYKIFGTLLLALTAFSVIWVKGIKKRGTVECPEMHTVNTLA